LLQQPWRITDQRNPGGTIKLELLDPWTTELDELMDGTGRSNRDQGVRFLDVSDPTAIK
jgi:hypothetical protein